MKWIINFTFYFISTFAFAQYKIEVLDSNTFHLGDRIVLSKISFRGLSVVDDQIVWLSGSRGTIARSIDGGKTFSFNQLKGYEKSDFRDIEAFDDKQAIIMSSGTPAYILKTIDGGQTWKEVYKNTDTAYFLDAMDFWNDKQGILVGDPVNRHFILLQTDDSGETWQQMDTNITPGAMPGEAVFAASGTSLKCWGKRKFGFVTGGSQSRILYSKWKSKKWESQKLSVAQGRKSQGSFSFAISKIYFIAAGGDYLNDTSALYSNFDYYRIDKKEIEHYTFPSGYKSCIEILDDKSSKKTYGYPRIILTGTSGTETADILCNVWTSDFRFKKISSDSFNVVRKAKKGKAVFLAGAKGRIGKLVY